MTARLSITPAPANAVATAGAMAAGNQVRACR